jgi:AraC-like DNA-binding protein
MTDRSIQRLAPLIERQALRYGSEPPIAGVTLSRRTSPGPEAGTLRQPSYCIVVQGAKEELVGNEVKRFSAGMSLIEGITLPISSHITRATPAEPFLSFSLTLEQSTAFDLLNQQDLSTPFPLDPYQTDLVDSGRRLGDAVARLLEILDYPDEVPTLAPLIKREIFWRLLQGAPGPVLTKLVQPGDHTAQIARATSWMRENYADPITIPDLAKQANMSVPSFHRHFKAVTKVSPLQFLKQLRLHDARRRILASSKIGMTAYDVGYDSLSQFNRDYRKFFGHPPNRDAANMRHSLQLGA